jgi:hypothetical protein
MTIATSYRHRSCIEIETLKLRLVKSQSGRGKVQNRDKSFSKSFGGFLENGYGVVEDAVYGVEYDKLTADQRIPNKRNESESVSD